MKKINLLILIKWKNKIKSQKSNPETYRLCGVIKCGVQELVLHVLPVSKNNQTQYKSTIKPRTKQNFIQNPYPPPNLQNMKKSSNPNPHEKTNPENSNLEKCETQKPPTQNMNFILHVLLQIKTNPID